MSKNENVRCATKATIQNWAKMGVISPLGVEIYADYDESVQFDVLTCREHLSQISKNFVTCKLFFEILENIFKGTIATMHVYPIFEEKSNITTSL